MEEAALRKLISASLGLAFLAAFTMANAANAATILTMGQTLTSTEVVTERVAGGQTILTTGSLPTAAPISVLISSIGGAPASVPAFETFTLTSNSVASPGALTLGGFSGTITFTATIGGPTILVAAVTNGTLSLNTVGGGGFLGDTVFSGYAGAIQAQVGGPPVSGSSSLSFSNVSGPISSGFTAQNSGTFSANVIPEPASLVSGGLAALAGLGLFGARRLRAAKA